jgi:glutamine amidotransferase
MCQLFAISSACPLDATPLVREFFSHAPDNPHGWGFADFSIRDPLVIRSSDQADVSVRAQELLSRPLVVRDALAHIRFATVGQVEDANCHPFVARDRSGRLWTLIHKGTIFDFEPLNPYFHHQQGSTDSERILLLLIDELDGASAAKGAPLEADERFAVFAQLVEQLSPGNCVNLIIYDSDQFYLHTNYREALNILSLKDRIVFSTSELSSAGAGWQAAPQCTPLAYKHGVEVLRGATHEHEYIAKDEDTRYLYQDFAAL